MWDDDDQEAERLRNAADGCVWALAYVALFVAGFLWWVAHYFGKG